MELEMKRVNFVMASGPCSISGQSFVISENHFNCVRLRISMEIFLFEIKNSSKTKFEMRIRTNDHIHRVHNSCTFFDFGMQIRHSPVTYFISSRQNVFE